MIDGESHSSYSECSIRWIIGHHTSTTLQMVACKSRGMGECCRFTRNMREKYYIIQGISSSIKTMEHIKKGVKVGDITIFSLEAVFIRLLTIGQQRHVELRTLPLYSSTSRPYGSLRRDSKGPLHGSQSLCDVKTTLLPDVTIVDVSQLFYIVWPDKRRCFGHCCIHQYKTVNSRWCWSLMSNTTCLQRTMSECAVLASTPSATTPLATRRFPVDMSS